MRTAEEQMAEYGIRLKRTRFPGLGYGLIAPGVWQFMDLHPDEPGEKPSQVGPHYRSRAELLADMERYARDGGWA